MRFFYLFLLLTFYTQARADHHVYIEYKVEIPFETENQDVANGFQVQYGNTLYWFVDYYLSWSFSKFNYGDRSYHIEKTGYSIGISSEYSFLSYLIGGYIGWTYKHYEIDSNSNYIQEGSHEFGFELGALLIKPLSPNWDLYGRVGYEDSSRSTKINSLYDVDIDDQLITSFGVRYNF